MSVGVLTSHRRRGANSIGRKIFCSCVRVGRGQMLFMVSGRVLEYTKTSGDRVKQKRARERESLAWVENSLWPD